jgi:hypothetical protein
MRNLTEKLLFRAIDYANISGKLAPKTRKMNTKLGQIQAKIDHWHEVFVVGDVLFTTTLFLFLVPLDFWLLMPMYREMSNAICGNPDKYSAFIGISIGLIVIKISHFFAKSAMQGPLFRWEIESSPQDLLLPEEVSVKELKAQRRVRREQAVLMCVILFLCIGSFLFLRGDLVGKAGKINAVQNQLHTMCTYFGLMLLFFQIIAGKYLMYAIQLIVWMAKAAVLQSKIKRTTEKIMENDRAAYLIWEKDGMQQFINRSLEEAIYRYAHRTGDPKHYCDEVPLDYDSANILINAKLQKSND